MKLTLSTQNGISILTGAGEVTAHDVEVLRAGLSQLFKSGKNRIILDLTDTKKVPSVLLREIAQLDFLARELSGRIVMSSTAPGFKEQVERFAHPPVLSAFDSREAALQQFVEAPEAAKDPAPAKPSITTPEELKAFQEKKVQEKAAVRQKELELKDPRTAALQFERENKMLREQLAAAVVERRVPPNEAAYQARIKDLESQIQFMMDQLSKIGEPKQKA